ncbi:MAG: hypothetical protein EBW87_03220 [Burkholderiaceae bacterium]|nr:hypothetical protein [Burkholderiaceae bacterium]
MPEVTTNQVIVMTVGDTKVELTADQARKLRDELVAMFPLPPVYTVGGAGVTIREPVIPNWPYPIQHQPIDRPKWTGSPPEIFCSAQNGIT